MRFVVDGLETRRGQVRVDLGGREGLMAQKLLHAAQIRSVVEQVGREAVSERVRADAGIESCLG